MSHVQVAVRNYMTTPLLSVRESSFVDHAHRRLQNYRVSALPVVDEEGSVVGVISRTDVLKVGRREADVSGERRLLAFPAKPVSAYMTPDPIAVDEDADLSVAAALMLSHRIHRVFVRVQGEIAGLVTTRDLMRAISEQRLDRPLSEFMSAPLFTVRDDDPVSLAVERLEKARVTGLVVVDADWPIGIFTQVEALEARDLAGDTATEDVMNPAILVLESDTPVHRAASQAAAMDVRRIVVTEGPRPVGIVTGLDFARMLG